MTWMLSLYITAQILIGSKIADINSGKVSFKIDGKTLKDIDNKVIYVKLVNGTVKIENFKVPSEWAKESTLIQAVYSGSAQCEKLTSDKIEIAVEKTFPSIITESITASPGKTISLTASITDGDKCINTGKVVLKINGKTVKDANVGQVWKKMKILKF